MTGKREKRVLYDRLCSSSGFIGRKRKGLFISKRMNIKKEREREKMSLGKKDEIDVTHMCDE